MHVRSRFAPSPTGVLHLGSVRTALFCWLFAHHHNGDTVLRIEDTDRQRSTTENVKAVLDGLQWLGLDFDEGPVFQTDRFDRYREVVAEWLDAGHAYHCYCTKEELDKLREAQIAAGEKYRYNGRCRDRSDARAGIEPVVRFRNPQSGEVVVEDQVRGRVVFDNKELDDLIIVRSDGTPTYNFTVIIDDSDMKISHVIRGDDHLNNTPRQINMLKAFGKTLPKYAHLPMILGDDGAKLSKRHGAVNICDYQDRGFLPEALLNYLVRLGWSHGDQEIFSRQEMIDLFDIANVNASASSFNPDKLLWVNRQHIAAMPAKRLGERLLPYLITAGIDPTNGPDPALVADAFRDRATTLVEMAASARYCYEDFSEIDATAARKHLRPIVLTPLKEFTARVYELATWHRDELGEAVADCAAANGINLGKLGQPIRVAITGGSVSPPIDVTLELLGRDRTLQRLRAAIAFVEIRAQNATA